MHWKKSPLVIHKILRLIVNTLIIDDKHYLFNRDNLTQPIQMQLYPKQKIFSESFLAFLKSILNFEPMPEKGYRHSRCISRNNGSEKHGEINV